MATEYLPWASGRRKPAPGRKRRPRRRGKSGLGGMAAQLLVGRHGLIAVVLAGVAVLMLGLALVLQSTFFYLTTVLGALGSLAMARAAAMEAAPKARPTGPVKPSSPKVSPPPGTPTGKPAPPSAGPVKCTRTGKPIVGIGKCGCASRHVASKDGAERYKVPIGSPLGQPKKQPGKPGSTS